MEEKFKKLDHLEFLASQGANLTLNKNDLNKFKHFRGLDDSMHSSVDLMKFSSRSGGEATELLDQNDSIMAFENDRQRMMMEGTGGSFGINKAQSEIVPH